MELGEYELMYQIEQRYWWFLGRRGHALRLLERWTHGARGLDILDVGCGTGANLLAFRRFGAVTGCDISPAAVAFCRKRGIADAVVQPEPDRLPFPDGRFDLITCLDVIEHVKDDVGMLREMCRVLKPGGAAFFTTPAFPALWSVHDESLHHMRRYRRRELVDKFAAAGFAAERITYLNALLLPLIVPVRWLRDRLTRSKGATSDFNLGLHPALNALFLAAFSSEAAWLRFAPLPFGLSLCALARRD
ncbi:MAG: class I SAM-dependent methyltransferase [bacterium]